MELLDLFDKNGNKLNKTIIRGEELSENEYIKLCVIYLKSNDKFLVQKCSKQKGGMFAITGGHVSSGNTSKQQAVLEVKEELSLDIDINNLVFLGNIYETSAIFDVFLYDDKELINKKITLQESEVESISWLSTTEIESLIEQNLVRASSVKHFSCFIKNKKFD